MIAARVITGVTNHFLLRLPEWALTAILGSFGMTLLRTGDTFANPSYQVLARYANENTWGTVTAGLAALRLVALVINGTFSWSGRWSVYVRSACCTLSVFVWFSLALGFFLANSSATGPGTYAVLMGVDIILAIFIAGQAGAYDRASRHGLS